MLIYAQVLPAAQRRTRRQWWHKQLRVPVFSWTGQVLYKSATKFKKKWMEEGAQGPPHPQPNCGRIINFLSPQVSLNGICSIIANVCRNLEVITDTALSLLGWIPWNPHCWWKMNSVTVIFHFYEMTRKRDSLETESRSVVAGGWQWRWGLSANRQKGPSEGWWEMF